MSEINDQDQQTRAWLNQCDDPEHDTLATDNEIAHEIIRALVDGRYVERQRAVDALFARGLSSAEVYAILDGNDVAAVPATPNAGLVSHLPETDWDGIRRGPGGRPWDAATEAAYGDTETEGTTP